MMEKLIEIDKQLLLAINGWHSESMDSFMWLCSQKWTWIPLYVLLVGSLVYLFYVQKRDWKTLLAVLLGFALTIALSDMISTQLFKNTICRLRPTHDPTIASLVHIVHDYRGGLYGFVSSHAANTMGIALLFGLVWLRGTKEKRTSQNWTFATVGLAILLVGYVLLNCYSRMYLGVHFPGDILGGLLVGAMVATGVYYGLVYWEKKWNH